MKLSQNVLNIILSFLDFLCLLIVSFFIYKYISPYSVLKLTFCGEALYEPYYNAYTLDISNSPFQIFMSSDHNWFLYSVVNVLTQRYLADFLCLHPVIYLENYQTFLFFGFFMLLLYSLLKSFTKYFSKVRFSCLLLPFIALLLLKPVTDNCFLWLFRHPSWGLAYIFLPIFLLFLLSLLERLYVNFQKPTKIEFVVIICLTLILSISHELHRFILCFGSFVLLFIHKLVFKTGVKRKYLLYWLLLVFVCSLCFFNTTFTGWFYERCISAKNSTDGGIFSLQYLIQHFSGYFNYLIKQNIILINILSVLLFFVYFFTDDKEKNKRFFIFVLTLLFSVYAFFIAIIIGNGYSDFSYENAGLRLSLIIILIYCILSVFGYFLQMSKNKNLKIFMVILSLVQFFTVFTIPDYDRITVIEKNVSKELKQTAYLMEKMFVLYGKEHNKYYYIKMQYDIGKSSLMYLLYRYDKNSSVKNYDAVEVCEVEPASETAEICYNKYIKLIKEKTGQTITHEELEKHDFSSFDEYAENNRKNIHNKFSEIPFSITLKIH